MVKLDYSSKFVEHYRSIPPDFTADLEVVCFHETEHPLEGMSAYAAQLNNLVKKFHKEVRS